jgi:hypothetical protein
MKKNRFRALLALLESRAYLESQPEAVERGLTPLNDSHLEHKPRPNDQSRSKTLERRRKAPDALAA